MTVQYQRSTVHSVADVRAIADHAGSYFFSRKAAKACAANGEDNE